MKKIKNYILGLILYFIDALDLFFEDIKNSLKNDK